jgi:hypothetical protein
MAVSTETYKTAGEISTDGADISPEELSRRVLVLKRFRSLLQDQRDRFRAYLDVLDKQKDVIESGNADDLLSHVELEEQIVADIFSIQKVINPLEDMYHSLFPQGTPSSGRPSDDVSGLKAVLEDLKNEAVLRSAQNKELLSKRMLELRSEIQTLRNNPYAAKRSSFSDANTASLVDIRG